MRKFIGSVMGSDSYGIPIGPYASRLLAEALLIDVDASLEAQHVDFVRWVDDYNVVRTCKKAVTDYRTRHGVTEPIRTIDLSGVFWQKPA